MVQKIARIFVGLLCLMLAVSIHVSAFCCSIIEEKDWFGINLKTCYVKSEQVNDNSCSDLRTDIGAFSVEGQRGITELPPNVGERFPNLEIYDAGSCSITKLTKLNFAKLSKLRKLWLGFNQITEVPDGVFDDLGSLDFLAIDSNKVSKFGLNVFNKLNKLDQVHLEKNKCINLNFYRRSNVLTIPGIVEENCGRPPINTISSLLELQFMKDIEAKKLQLEQKNNEIVALKKTLDEKVISEKANVLQSHQKDNEILELKRKEALHLQEIATLKTLQIQNNLLTETFTFLSSQIEQKDRLLVESSAKLHLLTKKIEQKDNAINYLQQKTATMKACQESK